MTRLPRSNRAVAALGNGAGVSAQDTVPFALWCAGHRLGDYEEALWLTVGGLGDRDTTCAIVGGIVSLFTGPDAIPEGWLHAREPLPGWHLGAALRGARSDAPVRRFPGQRRVARPSPHFTAWSVCRESWKQGRIHAKRIVLPGQPSRRGPASTCRVPDEKTPQEQMCFAISAARGVRTRVWSTARCGHGVSRLVAWGDRCPIVPESPAVDLQPAAVLPLSPEEFRKLRDSIRDFGVQTPLLVTDDYLIIDGHERWRAIREIGLTRFPLRIVGNLAESARVELAIRLNIERRHLTVAQRRELAARLLKEEPWQSDRKVASSARCDHKTVGRVRLGLVSGGEIPNSTTATGKDGKTYRRPSSVGVETAASANEAASLFKRLGDDAPEGNNTLRTLRTRAHRKRREKEFADAPATLPRNIKIYNCDFRDLKGKIEANSVDLASAIPLDAGVGDAPRAVRGRAPSRPQAGWLGGGLLRSLLAEFVLRVAQGAARLSLDHRGGQRGRQRRDQERLGPSIAGVRSSSSRRVGDSERRRWSRMSS